MGSSKNIVEWKWGEYRVICLCTFPPPLRSQPGVLSFCPGRGPWSWWGAAWRRELPGTRCPTALLALGSCELLMSIRRKDGSWNSFTRQSYHHGGWIQLQPHAGVHALQHQSEQVPASACAHVSIPGVAFVCVCLELRTAVEGVGWKLEKLVSCISY